MIKYDKIYWVLWFFLGLTQVVMTELRQTALRYLWSSRCAVAKFKHITSSILLLSFNECHILYTNQQDEKVVTVNECVCLWWKFTVK